MSALYVDCRALTVGLVGWIYVCPKTPAELAYLLLLVSVKQTVMSLMLLEKGVK